MQPKQISAILVIALAIIAAIVAVGLMKKKRVQWFIVLYWIVLTVKNTVDCINAISGW